MRGALRVAGTVLVFYLMQTTVFHLFPIWGVLPDLVAVGVILIGLDGDVYTGFCAGCLAGLLMDAMIGQVAIIYLLFYPLLGWAGAALSRKIWRTFRELPLPFLVAPVVTLLVVALKEGVMLGYVYLSGVDIVYQLVLRAGVCALYSGVLALPLQWPTRAFLDRPSRRSRLRIRRGKKT